MKSKFDVRDYGLWAEIKQTLLFGGYVIITFFAYLVIGGLVRRAYRRAVAEDRIFYVDRLPGGRADP